MSVLNHWRCPACGGLCSTPVTDAAECGPCGREMVPFTPLVTDERAIERAALELVNRDREESIGASPVRSFDALDVLEAVDAGYYRSRARAVLAAALQQGQED